ncbi:MAG: hypothetical protein RQ982_08185, partial [Gammaproteobacteria bacterium]|nr:hypothetical protein [Gammaproteobacteria bacterium]
MNNKPVYIAFTMLLLFIGGSIWLVFEYVSAERQRDLDDWQARLGIMVESQQHAVENWFAGQSAIIAELAANPLLQIYVSQLYDDIDADSETSRGQLHHLKNLINASAEHAAVFTVIKDISNNQRNKINDGLALVNEKGLLLSDVPFNAQVGIIGHELAHVIDYEEKTAMGVVFTGI